jgi:glycerophosphoryl diester phosphodiesterase
VDTLVIAHRGSSASHPEHTEAAYLAAIDEGADGLECDVRLTRDGHLVCIHDRKVDRTSNGRGLVSNQTLEQLSELDYSRSREDTEPEGDAEPAALLTLDQLLQLATETKTKLFVETKHPVRFGALVEAKLTERLDHYGLTTPSSKEDSLVTVMSFSITALRRTRQLIPHIPTVFLTAPRPPRRDGNLPDFADIAGPGISWLRTDPGYAERVKARGHATYCWTVDDPADVRLCVQAGVRYLATNTPAAARRMLDER